jgi:hypothetical protein
MTIKIEKAIKRATKPKASPIKDKYITAIIESATKEKDFAIITQLLLPRINKLSSVHTCLKGHMVFHNLLSLSDYSFWKFLLQSYRGQSCSSIYSSFQLYSIKIDNNDTNPSNKSEIAVKSIRMANYLPNLIHMLSQNFEITRLASYYNRYLRERLLHYKHLRIDIITEKLNASSFVDNRYVLSLLDNPGFALDQLQCALQQMKLILDCNLSPCTKDLGELCMQLLNMLAMDLAVIFSFVNLALVSVLQHFFTLPKIYAEKVLFIYKEYTQLSLCHDVKTFVQSAQVSVSESFMQIPSSLKLDSKSITSLTKSLETYLYNHYASTLETQSLASSTSNSIHSSKAITPTSSMSSLETSTSSYKCKKHHHPKPNLMKELPKPTVIKRSKVPPNIIVPTYNEYMAMRSGKSNLYTITNNNTSNHDTNNHSMNSINSNQLTDHAKDGNNAHFNIANKNDKSNMHLNTQASTYCGLKNKYLSVTPDKRNTCSSFESTQSAELFQVSSIIITKPTTATQIITIDKNYTCTLLPSTQERLELQPATILAIPATPEVPAFLTPVTPAHSPRGVPTTPKTTANAGAASTSTTIGSATGTDSSVMIENPCELELPPDFDMDNATMDDWQSLFDSLGDSGVTFSLKFDIAAALQRSITRYEKEQKEEQQQLELQKQQQ